MAEEKLQVFVGVDTAEQHVDKEVDDLENILTSCKIEPMVNQVLCHISNTPFELIDFCNKNEMQVEAYLCGSAHCQVADYWSQMLGKKDIVA